jgi:hypothetical protein
MMEEPMLCSRCKQPMDKRPEANMTREQRFCGDWYDCLNDNCEVSGTLIPSDALKQQLAEMSAETQLPLL